jgi:AbrB family looped-hinge helix DNA binding protein
MKNVGRVTSKGQLVIPAQLRRELHIGRGMRVRFERLNGGFGVYPNYKDNIDQVRGSLAGLGLPASVERDTEHELK